MDVLMPNKDQFHFQKGMILLSHCLTHLHNFLAAHAAISLCFCENNSSSYACEVRVTEPILLDSVSSLKSLKKDTTVTRPPKESLQYHTNFIYKELFY